MPNIKSAKKRVEITRQRTIRNASLKSGLKTEVKRFEQTLEGKDPAEASTALRRVVSKIQKAATKGIVHKKTAARKVSRLQRKLNAAH